MANPMQLRPVILEQSLSVAAKKLARETLMFRFYKYIYIYTASLHSKKSKKQLWMSNISKLT
jgi:hypothetical protein